MIRISVTLFVLGLIAMLLGMENLAGISFELGRILLFVFVGLAIAAFVGSWAFSRRLRPPI